MAILQHLNRLQGITTVVVTQEPDIATYANRIIFFAMGGSSATRRLDICMTLTVICYSPPRPKRLYMAVIFTGAEN